MSDLKNLQRFIFILGGFLFLFFLSAPLVSAFYVNATWQIKEHYIPSEILSGSLNLSLADVASSSLLTSSFGGSIGIKDFLDNNSASYSCIPVDCEHTYSGTERSSSKSFSLGSGEQKILGFKIEGDVRDGGITDFLFRVNSNAPASCSNPLQVDVLDDQDIQYAVNYSFDDYSCYATKGCFTSDGVKEVYLGERDYCNKVTLVAAPAYRLGAFVKKSGQANLTMKLFGIDSSNGSIPLENAECLLPDPSLEGSEVSCILPYTVDRTGEYYVCISSPEGRSNYTIPYEEKNPRCGYYDFFDGNYTVDYHLFAKAARYGSFQGFVFNQDNQNVHALSLVEYLSEYLERRYQGDCTEGCIIPLTFISGVQQEITIDNAYLSYSNNVGPVDTRDIFDVKKSDALLTLKSQDVDLSRAGFKAPNNYGNFNLMLSISGIPFIKRNITVKKVPIVSSLYPLAVPQSVKTKFIVSAKSPENKTMVKYLWDFGDNTTAESTVNETDHSYVKIGIYTLKVTAIDSGGNEGSNTFTLVVGSAKDAVNKTLKELKTRITSLNNNISSKWYRRSVEERIKLPEQEKLLQEAQRAFLAAQTDDDYGKVVQKVDSIHLPQWIHEGNTINVPFVFEIKKINFGHLKELGAGTVSEEDEEKYENALWAWFTEKEKTKEYKIISALYDQGLEVLGVSFKIDVDGDEDMFLSIDRPFEHLQFLEDYSPVNLGGSTGIAFSGKKSFTFFVKGSVNPDELNIYLSPKLDTLEVTTITEPCNYNQQCEKDLGETPGNCKADCPPKKLTAFYIILLLLAAFAVYTFLQEWYRKRYESHLFKNRADIYNLLNFVGSALRQGLKKEEIAKKLKGSGWNSEQISYIFKKIEGKRVGLPGFNIFEILERRRNKKKFNNAQNVGVGFIRPPGPGVGSGLGRPLR